MQSDQADDNKQDDGELPAYNSIPSPKSGDIDKDDEQVATAASEARDTQPVFGSSVQPQKILDQELIGTNDNTEPFKGEDTVVNFDPENDPRMQEPLEEE